MNSEHVPLEFWIGKKEVSMHDPGDENDATTRAARRIVAGWQGAKDAESICAEADRLVSGERQQDYGHPLDNYTAIAEAAQALELDVSVPEHAALFMVVTKVAREAHRPKRDNRVDIAGYAKVVDLIHEERERRGA